MNRPPEVLLPVLRQLSHPPVTLSEVEGWVRQGRPQPHTYWKVWLRRVWRWPLS